jgi:hypothetical protein
MALVAEWWNCQMRKLEKWLLSHENDFRITCNEESQQTPFW